MTVKDMFIKALTFDSTDKVPLMPGYPRESTLKAWHVFERQRIL
ncbi:hypothetical protein [Caldanaerobius polysaccharolyticus]|nr:hypothetical protein [Caldanaerobius polysaccharolyticus]